MTRHWTGSCTWLHWCSATTQASIILSKHHHFSDIWNGAMTSVPTHAWPSKKILCGDIYQWPHRKWLIAQNVACQNNKDSSDMARLQIYSKDAPHKCLPQQLVLLDGHSFLSKNQKLQAPLRIFYFDFFSTSCLIWFLSVNICLHIPKCHINLTP